MKNEKLLLSLGFRKEFPDDKDKEYYQFVKHFKHLFIKGLHIVISDNIINVWGKEAKRGINGGDFLILTKKLSKKNLLKVLILIIQ